jgi:hypothetical protein
MPNRPRSHVLEAEARDRLREAFTRRGWTVEDLRNDYGEDMLVRIFDDGRATPWMFFVQSKATDNVERPLRRSGKQLRVAVRRATLAHWHRLWEPVLLTVWSPERGETYWETVQDAEGSSDSRGIDSRTVSVLVPTTNVLDELGLDRIRSRVVGRYGRYHVERDGARVLAEQLRTRLGVAVEYNAAAEVIIVEAPEGGADIHLLGGLARMVEASLATTGKSADEWLAEAFELYQGLRELYAAGRRLQITVPGERVRVCETLRDVNAECERLIELGEPALGWRLAIR